MAIDVSWSAMLLVGGVEVRTGTATTLAEVARHVNVEAALGVGVQTSDVVCDDCWILIRLLRERYGALDFGVAAEND